MVESEESLLRTCAWAQIPLLSNIGLAKETAGACSCQFPPLEEERERERALAYSCDLAASSLVLRLAKAVKAVGPALTTVATVDYY